MMRTQRPTPCPSVAIVVWIKSWGSDIASFCGEYCCTQDELECLAPPFLEIKTQQKRCALIVNIEWKNMTRWKRSRNI